MRGGTPSPASDCCRAEPQDPSTYLGHATITITLDRYGHLMPGSEVEAGDAERLLGLSAS
jgi:hypothetical protein